MDQPEVIMKSRQISDRAFFVEMVQAFVYRAGSRSLSPDQQRRVDERNEQRKPGKSRRHGENRGALLVHRLHILTRK